jgi:hypothetical protein
MKEALSLGLVDRVLSELGFFDEVKNYAMEMAQCLWQP